VQVQTGLQNHLLTAIYLHGFASSPHSGKAAYLGERLQKQGVRFVAPDLNHPDFSTLTVTRMIEQTGELIEKAPASAEATAGRASVTLIGSSLGAFVAVNAAVKWPDRVGRLVLMAPALDFGDTGLKGPGGADIGAWKAAGHLNVFHFAYGRMMPVHYELYEDARRYDAMNADLKMPVLVFQGRRDTAVDPATVEAWSRRRPNVELHMLDDDHQLTASLPYIWDATSRFLDSPL
jgi:pimeloyl-ACP methyl ester carboxylesterase